MTPREQRDLLIEIVKELGEDGGAVGLRMNGGGMGGCTVSSVAVDTFEKSSKTTQEACSQSGEGQQTTKLVTGPARSGMSFAASEMSELINLLRRCLGPSLAEPRPSPR